MAICARVVYEVGQYLLPVPHPLLIPIVFRSSMEYSCELLPMSLNMTVDPLPGETRTSQLSPILSATVTVKSGILVDDMLLVLKEPFFTYIWLTATLLVVLVVPLGRTCCVRRNSAMHTP